MSDYAAGSASLTFELPRVFVRFICVNFVLSCFLSAVGAGPPPSPTPDGEGAPSNPGQYHRASSASRRSELARARYRAAPQA